MRLINPDRLPIYSAVIYDNDYRITGRRCRVVKLEDLEAAEDEAERLYNEGFTKGYEIGSNNYTETNKDNVNHPAHYTNGNIECIDAMLSAFGKLQLMIYCKIAAFKYLWRADHKGNAEDIKKATWYLHKYTDLEQQADE